MENRNGKLRTLVLMMAAALFVVAAISVVAYLGAKESAHDGIVLPPDDYQSSASGAHAVGEGFITVSAENAPQMVAELQRPQSYHQSLTQMFASGGNSAGKAVEIWARGDVQKIVVSSAGQTRNILTDGTTAYLWYRDESWRVETVSLPRDVSPDDLSGIPTYETIAKRQTKEILEAAYVQLSEQDNAPCLYVSAENDTGVLTRYWVDLASGLLTKAECTMDGAEIYRMEQTGLSLLDMNDPNLTAQMLLPDGTDPFATAAAKTPQE